MFEFTRTKSIGVEKREDGIFLVHGFLDDKNCWGITFTINVIKQ